MVRKIELRVAVPEDLKKNDRELRIGQAYAICKEEHENISGLFVLDGNEDVFVLKMYLDAGQLFVPVCNPRLTEFLKEITETN